MGWSFSVSSERAHLHLCLSLSWLTIHTPVTMCSFQFTKSLSVSLSSIHSFLSILIQVSKFRPSSFLLWSHPLTILRHYFKSINLSIYCPDFSSGISLLPHRVNSKLLNLLIKIYLLTQFHFLSLLLSEPLYFQSLN